MKLLKMQANNFKKLKAVELDFDENDNLVKITGKNAQGKSTILDAIWAAIGGRNAVPKDPIRHGKDKAEITLEFDNMVVKRIITKNSQRLEVSNKDGASFKSPQSLLDNLISEVGLKPMEFAHADKKKQKEMLLDVVNFQYGDSIPEYLIKEKLKEDPITHINNVYNNIYSERRNINRKIKEKKEQLKQYDDIEKKEKVSISDLIAKKDRIEDYNREVEKKRIKKEEYERLIKEDREEIDRLKRKIQDLTSSIEVREDKLDNINNWLDKNQLKDTSEIKEKINNAEAINEEARKFEEKQNIKNDKKEYEKKSKEKTEMLSELEEYKTQLIENAEFPIDNLSYDKDSIYYQGSVFEEAATSEKLKVSFAIAQALNPKLKLLLIEHGQFLDKENKKILEKMAKDKDYLVLMEEVDDNEEVGIVIEDGEVKKNNYEALELKA